MSRFYLKSDMICSGSKYLNTSVHYLNILEKIYNRLYLSHLLHWEQLICEVITGI